MGNSWIVWIILCTQVGSLLQQRNVPACIPGSSTSKIPTTDNMEGPLSQLFAGQDYQADASKGLFNVCLLTANQMKKSSRLDNSSLQPADRYCNECNKLFPFPAALSRHKRSHSGERPYPCSQCPYRAKHRFDLKKHLVSIHKIEMQWCCRKCALFISSSHHRLPDK